MQQFVDTVLAVTKESVKTVTYEFLHNVVRLINGVSALLLALLPGNGNILEGLHLHGWELRPTFRGPRFPRWMEHGVSSFNKFIHELPVGSDASSVDYSSAEEDGDALCPPSPSSQSSRFSRTSSFTKDDGHRTGLIVSLLSMILFPFWFLLGLPLRICRLFYKSPKTPSMSGSHRRPSRLHSIKRIHNHVIHLTTDRRRGIIEDLHLGIEIVIEAVFDFFHKAAHFLLSPLEVLKVLYKWFSLENSDNYEVQDGDLDTSIPTATLGNNDPNLTERKMTLNQSLNTDARTCQDVITELGYPYEAIRVITSDGYVLLLERIPRRDSRKAVYLQHGVLDSSMGWVSNGVVGSPAFAAYDQGFDVFLGNLRGLVSREHIDKNISSRKYWQFSVNEHGTEDIPAMIEKIHQVKTTELKINEPEIDEEINNDQPYKLCAISHSLGGAAMLMYVIMRHIEEKPHRLSRLILLSPAGFHHDSTIMYTIVGYLFLMLPPILAPIIPALYIPTRFCRMLLNKLVRDLHTYPAVGGLVQTIMGYFLGGDSSNWLGVLGIPHYNMNDMPGLSWYVGQHLAQMKHAKKFIMYDYGSQSANMEAYGSPEPLDLGEYYRFIDIPVDVVAGQKDTVIRASMVRKHYDLMKDAGVDASYTEFEYAHLDFTFSHHEELLAFVMSRLLLVEPIQKRPTNQKSSKGSKSKRKGQVNS